MEKNMPCKHYQNKAGGATLISDKVDIKKGTFHNRETNSSKAHNLKCVCN